MEKEENTLQIAKPKKSSGLKFSLIWTLVFMIIGILLQSFENQGFIFGNFFTSNYLQWFKSFGNFADLKALNSWYYFFFSGGLISLVIAILKRIISRRHQDKFVLAEAEVKPLAPSVIQYEPQTQVAKDASIQSPVENLEKIKRIESVTQTKIEEWLEMGLLMLSEGNLEGAELVYEQISRAYDIDKDVSHETYKRILDFYYEIRGKQK